MACTEVYNTTWLSFSIWSTYTLAKPSFETEADLPTMKPHRFTVENAESCRVGVVLVIILEYLLTLGALANEYSDTI